MTEDQELNEILESKAHVQSLTLKQFGSEPRPTDFRDDFDAEKFEDDFAKSFCQWATTDGQVFVPTTHTQQLLTPGVYEIDRSSNIGLFFERIPVRTEGLVRFPDSNSDLVVEEIRKFWDRQHLFDEYGLIYKRGILLWGDPGSGKSCILQIVMEDVIKKGGIVIRFDDPDLFLEGMRAFRKIQPETPVVVIMEDIDSIIEVYSESEVLNILDGVNEVHKTIFLATTNYADKLGKRIVNRPSRFDKRFKIGMPNKEARSIYINHLCREKTPEALNVDVAQWVADTNNFSIAHIKELFIAVVILGDDYKKAVKTLSEMKEDIDDREYTVGFHNKS